jgi:integrase
MKTKWPTAKQQFLDWADESVSKNGARMFRSCMNQLDKSFAKLTIDKITRYMVEVEYVRRRRREGKRNHAGQRIGDLKDSTINRELTTLHRMMVKCEEWGLVENNPLRGLSKLSEPPNRERYLTDVELSALLLECKEGRSEHLWLIVVTALNTGMRKGDILTLMWNDISLERNEIRRRMQKTDRVHSIPMTRDFRQILLIYHLNQSVTDGYVFPSPFDSSKPMHPDGNIGFRMACERAGLTDFHFHDLRHTFATHFLRQQAESIGKDMALTMLQQLLGHSDIKTTMRYTHVLEEDKRMAMESFRIGV